MIGKTIVNYLGYSKNGKLSVLYLAFTDGTTAEIQVETGKWTTKTAIQTIVELHELKNPDCDKLEAQF